MKIKVLAEDLLRVEEEKKMLVEKLAQSQYALEEYQNSLQTVLTFIKTQGCDEALVEYLYNFSKVKPQEMCLDQIIGIRECLEVI